MSESAPLMIGVSGVRGIIGQSLTPVVAANFGAAFGTLLGGSQCGARVVVGRDSRPSGLMVRDAVASGLQATGCHVVDLNVVSTPGTALMTALKEADGGLVITASHNPLIWNGIKFLQANGTALSAQQAQKLADCYHAQDFRYADVEQVGGSSSDTTTHMAHCEAVLRHLDKTLVSSKRYKVALDSVNGAGCSGTAMLLSKLGCELIHLNGEPSGRFAHTPEPIAENLTELAAAVESRRVDVGFAQDPDADRLAIVDETGCFIGEEYTLALAAKSILAKRGKGATVAANLSTSRMIDDLAVKAGTRVIRTKVGEANVAEAMAEHDCVLGGEGNGGLIVPGIVPVRDSFSAIGIVLELMAESGKSISQLVAEIPRYHMIKTKFIATAKRAKQILNSLPSHFADQKVDTQDGLRVDWPDKWVNIRASNTELIVRVMAEAKTEVEAQELVDHMQNLVERIY